MRSHGSRVRKAAPVREPALIPRIGPLLEALPEAVVTTDTAHRVTGWNGAAERLFGFSRSSMIGASVLEILPYKLGSGTDTDVKAALERGETLTGGAASHDAAGAAHELRFAAAPREGMA